MENNRPLTIYTASSRKQTVLQAAPTDVQGLFERLGVSQALPVTHDAYIALPKAKQDATKDTGAYIAGDLQGGRRRNGCVLTRCAAVLDADNLPTGGAEEFIKHVDGLGCCYLIHSTAKHSPATPRLRAVFPFAEDLPAEQYAPVARLLCQLIQLEMTWFDPSTDEAGRIMYYPAHCQDIAPVLHMADRPLLDAAALLARLPDWRDTASWPRFPREQTPAKAATKQEDPEGKNGVVGAFCRVYDVPAAMEKFLPGVYEPTTADARYTFAAGSSWGGATVYEGGKFLFSHHATDLAGGRLVNAFDMVRLHRFAGLDDDAKKGTRGNRLPSYEAMTALAQEDTAVSDELNRGAREKALAAFGPTHITEGGEDVSWMRGLDRNSNGNTERTSANIIHVLEHDPSLKGRIYRDSFAARTLGIAPLPWGNHPNEVEAFEWRDEDDSGLEIYLEKLLGFRAPTIIKGVLNDHLARHSFDPVTSYLGGPVWDGVPRLDTLFIDYLGAEDNPYTRAVTRKAFTAAVARAMRPGIKYDTMPVLSGRTGLGKSTLLDIMGSPWYTDSLQSFEGKDASELLQGVWLVEIAELQAFNKSDVNRVKQFLSMRVDRFRASYGHRAADYARRCVFFGTTNARAFLRDPTGGRRFWPVYVGIKPITKDLFRGLPLERDQMWAEAAVHYQKGERLYLPPELEAVARGVQEDAREVDEREGMILDFLERPIPKDWPTWPVDRRRMFFTGGVAGELELVPRDRVCALEVWCELFCKNKADILPRDSRAINDILEAAPGWERDHDRVYFGELGRQRGFKRMGIGP